MIKHFSTWTQEDKDLYKERFNTMTRLQLQRYYQCHERTITNINKALGLVMPVKNYKRRKDANPVGTIVFNKNNKKETLMAYVVLEEGRQRLHIYNWLQAGRGIPEGYLLGHIDHTIQDPLKLDALENLVLKTRQSVIQANVAKRIADYIPKTKELRLRVVDPKKAADIEIREQLKADRIKAREERQRQERERKEQREQKKHLKLKIKEERAKAREEQLKEKERKQRERELIRTASEQNHRFKKKEKRFENKPVDVSKLIAVRINHKTIVYAKSEQDIPRIIERYSKIAS